VPATENRSKLIFYLFKNNQLNERTQHRAGFKTGCRASPQQRQIDHLINRPRPLRANERSSGD
jgi:hypothetical protein